MEANGEVVSGSTGKIGPELVIITGMSGAGRTEAMHTFEDLGYYCIDNLPPALIMPLVDLIDLPSGSGRPLCVVCDVRAEQFFSQLISELEKLSELDITFSVVFLDADDHSLRSRYSALRRRHPLSGEATSVTEAISAERKLLASIRSRADLVVNTTRLKPQELRAFLQDKYSSLSAQETMSVTVFSFGFKHGNPVEGDIVMDVRFLPNPYYVPELKGLTGFDEPVYTYVVERDETKSFFTSWKALLDSVMPGYVQEGKRHLSIGIGCTGGQHRSVVIARATAEYLTAQGYRVISSHRDIHLAQTASDKQALADK